MKTKQNGIAICSISLAVTGSLLAAAAARADMVTLYQNAYSYSNGGEFNAIFTSGRNTEVFCDEIGTEFNPGTSYTYQIVQTDSEGYTLTQGAAYLYSLFIGGTLQGYDYTDASTRKADAGLLQAALWTIQGQTGLPGGYTVPSTLPASPAYNPFYALAYSNLAFPTSANDGLYPVDIMQMYSGGTPAQAQFVAAPEVPMTHAMVFGCLAIAGYGLLRRKSTATAKV